MCKQVLVARIDWMRWAQPPEVGCRRRGRQHANRYKERVDDRFVAVTRVALGLTVSGQPVHTHELDPIQTTDYPELFFFFQAEDGIRDLTVTGVQTCALPI